MIKDDIQKAFERLDQKSGAYNQLGPLSFGEFIEKLVRRPERVLRNIFQVFCDMVGSYVGEGVNEYPDDSESIGYLNYDTAKLLVDGADSPFFADRLFANRLMRQVREMRQGAKQNKIYIFDGPPGSGKSTFLNNLLMKFEEYANTSQGMRYEAIWRLDREVLGNHGGGVNPAWERLHMLLDEAFPERDWRGEVAIGSNGFSVSDPAEREERLPVSSEPILEVPCPSHDHPILMIPKEFRRQFFLDLLSHNPFLKRLYSAKEYEWVFKGQPCTICMALYQALYEKLKSHREVLKMLYAKPYLFNRRLGEGISVFNPGDETSKKPFFTNPALQKNINQILSGGTPIHYLYSRYAKTNDGIYALMDIKSHNANRLVELHNIVSEGLHKVENIEERVNSLLLALMNPEDKVNIKNIQSFSERIEYVNIPYVLDHNTEVKIHLSIFGPHVAQRFLPRVLHNFARVIIATRLETESQAISDWLSEQNDYGRYCDKDLLLLKMELYAGHIPGWLSEEDVKRFTAKRRRRLFAEAEKEGCKGLSGRDSIKLFGEFYGLYGKKGELINMKMLNTFFAKVRKDLLELIPDGFLDALLSMYDYSVLQQIKESLYYYNEERISKDIQNYLFALNFGPGATVTSEYTGEKLVLDEEYFKGIEEKLLGFRVDEERRRAFRNETQKSFTSKTLTQQMLMEGLPITETELYQALHERYVYNIKAKVLDPFVVNENFRRAIKAFGTEEFKAYDQKIQNDVSYMMQNLQRKCAYNAQGAREVCIDIIDREVAQKFSSSD